MIGKFSLVTCTVIRSVLSGNSFVIRLANDGA